MALVLVATSYSLSCLATQTKLAVLCHQAPRSAKRLLGIPDFRHCAITDGVREILNGRSTRALSFATVPRDSSGLQLDLFENAGPQAGRK